MINLHPGKFLILFLSCFAFTTFTEAQDLRLNEVMSANTQTLFDEDGEASDWLELFNYGTDTLDLDGYRLSDSKTDTFWIFPSFKLAPQGAVLVFASEKDRKSPPYHWSTFIDLGDTWHYLVPASEPSGTWRQAGFDDQSWSIGESGFGFADGDDNTMVDETTSIFIRKSFSITSATNIGQVLLHVDYDDAFVAYLNGVEVARANITTVGPPKFDDFADNPDHEAQMYTGGNPSVFEIDPESLITGENLLAIQVHNASATSTDLTLIPFLSIGTHEPTGDDYSASLDVPAGTFHSDFKISSEGEVLYLKNPDGSLIDSIAFESIPGDVSYGRELSDPDVWSHFDLPTPGQPNTSEGKNGTSAPVLFSREGGFYNQNLSLSLSAGANAQIFYTLDGSKPTSQSTRFQGSIQLTKTTVVRAIAIESGVLASLPVTQTFLIRSDHKLPVVSISTDPENLWDETTGIHAMGPNASSDFPYFGANFWMNWERPIHIELYEPNGDQAFSVDAGVEIFGGWSRGNSQKSLAIHFRNQYGTNELEYPIFENYEIDKFSSLVLRTSGNDWNRTMFRDAFCTSLFHPAVDKQAYRPAVLYINGEYWGIQNIREKINEDFLASHHDVDPDDLNLMDASAEGIVEGSSDNYYDLIRFMEVNSLAIQSNFDYIASEIDVANYMHYFVGNILIDNQDWPGNNTKWWKANGDTTKWRWIAYDTDYSTGIYDNSRYAYNTINFALAANGPNWPNPPWSTFIFRKLMLNPGFKQDFINAMADQLNTNFQPAHMNAVIDRMADTIEDEIDNHMIRWGSSLSTWHSNVNSLREFSDNRATYMKTHIQSTFKTGPTHILTLDVKDQSEGGIHLNTLSLDQFPWSGEYFEGNAVEITAVPKPGYRFVRWEGDLESINPQVSIDLQTATSLKAVFELADEEITSLVINEVNYNSDKDFDSDDWIEIYNNGSSSIDLAGWHLTDDDPEHKYLLPTEELAPGAYLVVCRDMEKFEDVYPGTTTIAGNTDFGWSSDGDCVKLSNSDGVITDEVCYTNVDPWPELADGKGYSMALLAPNFNNSLASNWYAEANNGSPGVANDSPLATTAYSGKSILLYPNPVNNQLTIELTPSSSPETTVVVYNQQGTVVATLLDRFPLEEQTRFVWDLPQDLGPGLYILEKRTSDKSQVYRFVVIDEK